MYDSIINILGADLKIVFGLFLSYIFFRLCNFDVKLKTQRNRVCDSSFKLRRKTNGHRMKGVVIEHNKIG